jgi:hypothetical protein
MDHRVKPGGDDEEGLRHCEWSEASQIRRLNWIASSLRSSP